MSFTLILTINIVLDVALLGLLAFAMTRAGKLTPHRPGVTGNVWRLRNALRQHEHAAHGREQTAYGREHAAHAREERSGRRLSPALD